MGRLKRSSLSDAGERPRETAVIENNVRAEGKSGKLGFLLGSKG
jgi:hypothetical protein